MKLTVLSVAFPFAPVGPDAVAFTAHGALALLGGEHGRPALIEVPLYRAAGEGWVRQSFEPRPGSRALSLKLSDTQVALKRRMIEAHATQSETLAGFDTAYEHFRLAPSYDFTALPNGGSLLYERYDWQMTGSQWQSLAHDALMKLQPDFAQ